MRVGPYLIIICLISYGVARTKNSSESEIRKKREKCKESMRRLREQIKSDPIKYEESKKKERERYHGRKAAGKIKSIKDMNTREQRHIRKIWRQKVKARSDKNKVNQRLETFLLETTPPNSPRRSPLMADNRITPRDEACRPSGSRQSLTGQKIRRKNREELKNKIDLLTKKLKKSEKRCRKYRTRYYRLKNSNIKTDKESPQKQELKKLVNSLKVGKL